MKTFEFLILHWKISVLTTNKIVDRLPGFWSLSRLGVPRLTPGKASEASAATAHEAIVAWNIADEVKRKCFDTTSVKVYLETMPASYWSKAGQGQSCGAHVTITFWK